MAHKQCIDRLDKRCDCIKDDLEELQREKKHKHNFKPKNFFGITLYQCGCGIYDFKKSIRDPKRIGRIIRKFGKLWKANNDLRFGQLYDDVANYNDKDGYYLEDDLLEEYLDKLLEVEGKLGRIK
jgi:hypothetical protein